MPVNTTHPTYDAALAEWKTLRDAYNGSEAIRRAGATYLPRPTGMTGSTAKNAAWAAYLARPEWYPATSRTVKGLTGSVFRKDPQIDLLEGDGTDMLRQDITGTGVSLLSFLAMALQETIHIGRYGILLDWDEEKAAPVWSGYSAEAIPNWDEEGGTFIVLTEDALTGSIAQEGTVTLPEVTDTRDGRTITMPERSLSLLLRPVTRWRLLSLVPDDRGTSIYRQDTYELMEQSGQTGAAQGPFWQHVETIIPRRRGEPLDFLPFVFLGPETTEWGITRSPISNLVRINLRYWRHSADYEHGLHLTCLPTPWTTGHDPNRYLPAPGDEGKQAEAVFVLGSGEAFMMPEPEAKIGLLTMSANDLGAMIDALETDKRDMATIGARLLEERPQVEEREIAVRLRQSGDESIMKALSNAVSHGATNVLRWHEWWLGKTDDPEDERARIALNTDFVSRDMNPQLVAEIRTLQAEGYISLETVHYNLEKGEIIEPGISFDEERARIESNPPMVMRLGVNGVNPLAENEDENEEDEET